MGILDVKNLTFTYPLCENPAVDDVSFTAGKGDFVAVCGATGSGKSTLLRLLKRELSPLGQKSGSVHIGGVPQDDLNDREAAQIVGYVIQRPEQQIVTDKVWHELAFGLENLGTPQTVIARRVAEIAAYFGIESWYDRKTAELSGGQKQLLNLAAVMVTDPDILILDEPTAQLDPIAASDFITTLKKLNRELSLTIIITEHRLEEVIAACDKLLILEHGALLDYDAPQKVIARLGDREELWRAMPAAARICHAAGDGGDPCPLDIREGRAYIESHFQNDIRRLPVTAGEPAGEAVLQFRNVCFRYERTLSDVLCGMDLTVFQGEIFCILGGNGAGKTTALCAAADLVRPYSGYVEVFGKKLKAYKNGLLYKECLSLLPQDVQTVFLANTVREELCGAQNGVEQLPVDITPLFDKHPYDLSGGEQQLVALAKVLAAKPRLLLLDEPTKGLDANAKYGLAQVLKSLKAAGLTIVIVTHDAEFSALCADRCAMMFRGNIVSVGAPVDFFAGNSFYTTAANRMTRGYYDGAVTVEQVVALCRQNDRKGGA